MTAFAPIRSSTAMSVLESSPHPPVRDFAVNGQPILDQPLDCPGMIHDAENLDLSEYLVGINWCKTVPLSEAKTFPGVFANQNIVCKLRDPDQILTKVEILSIMAHAGAIEW